jgi:hypothetical protein
MDQVSSARMAFDLPSQESLLHQPPSRPFSARWKESSGGPLGWHISEMQQHLSCGVSGRISE